MTLPSKFEAILKENQTLHSIILDTITSFEPIYKDNKLFFFEEYTDHGIRHIESVLASAEHLVTEDSLKNLTAKDIGLFILSVILHDIGMHCEFSTFVSLLSGEYDKFKITSLDEKTWKELWDDYLTEVKRFSSLQKKNIFGNEFQQYTEPDLSNKDNLNGYDKKLIGEFIRRHHARLAHEIAFNGLFGNKNEKISFGNEKLSLLYRQLCGIIARSHGMNLRDTFEYLTEIASEGWRNPDDINVIFLMVLLRIADYIQIDKTRASSFLLKLKSFNSPVSLKEHTTHLSIESLSFNQPDNEKIYASCRPSNSEMLIKLKTLFSDIQKELDISWAVLGEVYGFFPTLIPKIKYRRISSNLEDSSFLNKLHFVPLRVKFEVNNDLSRLLVAPLYGNNPTYGIRELVQNSVDACLERNHIEQQRPTSTFVPLVKVSITNIDEGSSLFQITDNGKGMSLDEILNYFLNVGSSFRKSLSWKKKFIDEEGHSSVNRNGKFGIGVLAAFLIGDELTIKTRHYSEEIVYSFNTSIDSDYIDIKKELGTDGPIGTSISIIISNDKKNEILQKNKPRHEMVRVWTDWYVNDFPKVEYYLDNEIVKRSITIDRRNINSFNTDNFKRIEWKYLENKSNNNTNNHVSTMVVCNGIIITTNLEHAKTKFIETDNREPHTIVIEKKPSFLFEDPEGIFPIKLDRNEIDCIELPFEKELYIEVVKDFIGQLLTLTVDVSKFIKAQKISNSNSSLIFSKEGYSLNIDYFIEKLRQKNLCLLKVITSQNNISNTFLDYENCVIFPKTNEKINLTWQEENVAPYFGGRVFLKNKNYQELFIEKTKRLAGYIKQSHVLIFENEDFVIYEYREPTGTIYMSKSTVFADLESRQKIDIDGIESIQEIKFDHLRLKGGEVLNKFLNDYIGDDIIIPYDLADRKLRYSKAFSELEVYMNNNYL